MLRRDTGALVFLITGLMMSAETGEQPPTPPPPPPSAPDQEEVVGAVEGPGLVDVADFFPEIGDDLTEVTWAHRVNSLAELQAALTDPKIMMLEADVLGGQLKEAKEQAEEGTEKLKEEEGQGEDTTPPRPPVPIMAHPPEKESDLTVAMWLDKVIAANEEGQRKGIKLDFKEMAIVKESLQELVKRKDKIMFPVWLNADILPGPINSPVTPLPADEFLAACTELFPQATLSIGWTTFVAPNSTSVESGYEREHMGAMGMLLEAHHTTQPVTFPIRAALVPHSIDTLEWLLETVPDSTITIWGSPLDPFDPEAIATLVNLLGHDAVYLDLPETQMAQYRQAAAAAAAAEGASGGAKFRLLPTSASAWATVGMALASALAALYLYE